MASYGPIYEFAFDSQNGADILIVISKKNYTGNVTRRPLGRAPILKRENNENIYGTSLEIYAECKVDGEYAEFYTSSADEFKVDVYKNQSPLWTGFITPELYSEPDIAPPYDVQIIATDGLGELKNFTFSTKGVSSIYDHLRSMLDHIELARPLSLVSSLTYGDADVQSDPVDFFSIRVDLEHEIGESCYDVLQRLLASFHAGMTLHNGEWVIFRVTDFIHMAEGEWMQGVHSNGLSALFSIVDFGSMTDTDWWPIGQLSTSIEPAKKSLVVEAPNAYRANALSPEWDMENGASYNEEEKAYILPDEGSNIMQTIDFGGSEVGYRLGLRIRAMNVGEGDEDQGIGVMLKIDAHTASGYADYYLHQLDVADRGPGSYSWNTKEDWIEGELAVPTSSDTSNDAQDIDIIIPLYDTRRPGVNSRSWIYARSIEITIFNPQGTHDIYVYDVSLVKYEQSEGYQANVNIDNAAREVGDTVTTSLSDASKVPVEGYLFQSGIPLFPDRDSAIRAWKIRNGDSKEYLQLMAEDYAMAVALPRMEYRGALNVPLRTIPFLFRREGTYYFPRTYSYNLINDELEVDLISIPAADITASSVVVSQMTQSEGSFSSSGSGGGGGIGSGIDLSGYAKAEDVTKLIDLLASMWSIDNAGNLVADKQVIIKNNLIVEGDTASGGDGGGSSSVGIQGIVVNGTTYRDTDGDGLIDLGTIGGGTLTEITFEMIVEALGYTPVSSASLGSLAYKNGLTASDVGALSTSGGTLSGAVTMDGTVARLKMNGGIIEFNDASGNFEAYLRVYQSNLSVYDGASWRKIYHTGNFNPADYLPLSGGKITSSSYLPLIIESTASNNYVAIRLKNASTQRALGIKSDGTLFITNVGAWDAEYPILHSDNYSNYALPLNGGTIGSGLSNSFPLLISSTNDYTGIAFYTSGGTGYMRFQGGSKWGVTDAGWNNTYTLLHSGNIGEHNAGGLVSEYLSDLNIAGYNKVFSSGFQATNRPSENYATGFTIYNTELKYTYQLAFNTSGKLFARYNNNSAWQSWKTIAFTDSNVASAQALKHSNGTVGATAESSGRITFASNVTLGLDKSILDPSGRSIFMLDGNNSPQIGFDTVGSYSTYINGKDVYLRYGSSRTAGLILNSSGNVTIGNQDLARADVKMAVYGTTRIHRSGSSREYLDISLDDMSVYYNAYDPDGWCSHYFQSNGTTRLMINGNNGNVGIGTTEPYCLLEVASSYKDINPINIAASAIFAVNRHKDDGLFIGHDYTKKGSWIQSAYYGTEANPSNTHTYKLFLQPLGGNVLIGTTEDNGAKLQVVGGITTSGTIQLTHITIDSGNDIYSDNGLFIQPYGGGDVNINYLGTNTILNINTGNVGIGIATPEHKLDVYGSARIIGSASILGAVTMDSTLKVDSYIDITGTSRLRGNVTMDGDVHMGNNKGFYFKNSAGSGALSLFLSSSNVLGIAHSNIASVNIGVATTIEGALTVGAGATINGNLVVAGDISA